MDTILSIEEVSKKLKISAQQVRTYCREKRILAQRVGKSWAIPESSLEMFENLNTKDHPMKKKKKFRKPIALSFFSGAMGLDIGLEQAGFEILLACEIDKACRQTIQANKPDIALLGDLASYSADQIMAAIGLTLGDEVDLIVGGPPCQSFSTAGKRQAFKDQRGNIFLDFLDKALEIKPKFLVIENVRGLLSCPLQHRPHENRGDDFPDLENNEMPGGALRSVIRKVESSGYGVSFNLYNAANFGSPQSRERVVIVCSRDGEKMPFLMPTHSENGNFGLPKWRSVKDVFLNLPKECHHVNFPESRLKFYRMLKSGQYWKHLPEHLQKVALGQSYYAGGGKTGFFRRLAWDKPSPTLVTHPAMPATDLAHPVEDRPLSIEEYKRIQEFPDTWQIIGSLSDQYKQVGNAVPISLGKAIGKLVIDALKGKKQRPPLEFSFSRYRNTDDKSWLQNYEDSIGKKKSRSLQPKLAF